jgi:hypothetical protein
LLGGVVKNTPGTRGRCPSNLHSAFRIRSPGDIRRERREAELHPGGTVAGSASVRRESRSEKRIGQRDLNLRE